MSRPKRSPKDIERIKFLLADIIEDEFVTNGQVITHERLAKRHVARNSSTTAAEDVALYGGAAVAWLRRDESKQLAIVPITGKFPDWVADPDNEDKITSAIDGLGAGGPRIGWYQPVDRDDWLWIYYIGHLAKAGVSAVFHAGEQVDHNKQLNTNQTRAKIAARATDGVPEPPGGTETKVLAKRIK